MNGLKIYLLLCWISISKLAKCVFNFNRDSLLVRLAVFNKDVGDPLVYTFYFFFRQFVLKVYCQAILVHIPCLELGLPNWLLFFQGLQISVSLQSHSTSIITLHVYP